MCVCIAVVRHEVIRYLIQERNDLKSPNLTRAAATLTTSSTVVPNMTLLVRAGRKITARETWLQLQDNWQSRQLNCSSKVHMEHHTWRVRSRCENSLPSISV